MNKRYQVFVSSTFLDLQSERRTVIQTLMEMDCLPAGMELFPAADESQWDFIKKVIDDSDYYILIVAGRYGSVSVDGISYTEKEYDYALSKGMKILTFLHATPEDIPSKHVDQTPELAAKLRTFRAKVASGRLVKEWSNADQLAGALSVSLVKTITTYPAVGWIRADQAASADILSEAHRLREENEGLKKYINSQTPADLSIPNLAPLDSILAGR